MKKILIPTDFSQNSYQTVDYITRLFKNENCEFYFLNTYVYEASDLNAIEMLQADDDWFEKPKADSLEQLGKLVSHYTLQPNNQRHSFYAISEGVSLEEGIKKNIDKIGIDMVVLTSMGSNSIKPSTKDILEKIRSCPILIVPPHATASNGINLTIATDIQEKINTSEIEQFIKTLENTNTEINVLVLKEQNTLSTKAKDNLENLLEKLKHFSNNTIGLEFVKPTCRLSEYAVSHTNEIMCLVDKKPDLFRKIGLVKSKILSKLKKINTSTVLTVHQ